MKEIFELTAGDTTTAATQGSTFTAYALSPVQWEKTIVDAAKKRHFLVQLLHQAELPKGTKDYVIPYRTTYLAPGAWATSASEGSAVNYTKLDNLDGVTFTPTDASYGIAISNRAIRTNAVDILRAAREELTYRAGDVVDVAAYTALVASTNQATSSARGAQWLYGGDARLDSELTADDTLTTDMIADAKRMLMSTTCKYWNTSSAGAIQTSSAAKNPWMPEDNDPFVLLIAPEQENVLLKDSQFVNAAEYGTNEVILNGEIGKYLGIKILVSNNVPGYTTSDNSPDGESGANPGAAMHRCLLLKGKKAGAVVWGQKPKLHVFPYPSELETRLVLEMAYAVGPVHKDAMVYLDVADG